VLVGGDRNRGPGLGASGSNESSPVRSAGLAFFETARPGGTIDHCSGPVTSHWMSRTDVPIVPFGTELLSLDYPALRTGLLFILPKKSGPQSGKTFPDCVVPGRVGRTSNRVLLFKILGVSVVRPIRRAAFCVSGYWFALFCWQIWTGTLSGLVGRYEIQRLCCPLGRASF
jgi:hypothetical protein